jgi:hypothetical protein
MQSRVQVVAATIMMASAMASARLAWAEGSSPSSSSEARIVNVTPDSPTGWLPSKDQARAASETVRAYLAARDAGRTEAAYAMLEDANKAVQPFAEFSRQLADFNSRAGAVAERRIVTVTWTKDPAQAPKPGVYAAIDIVSRFAKIDRHCGYVVVYQSPAGGAFRVSGEQANFMTNADAATIERQKSRQVMEADWSQLSAQCPNYPGEASPASPTPLPEQADGVGYSTVAAALIDLRSKPGVTFKAENGWTVATDAALRTIWVFTSEGQPAYPAAIKRQIVEDGHGGSTLEMGVLCEASKADCDNLVRTFQGLNARLIAALRGERE